MAADQSGTLSLHNPLTPPFHGPSVRWVDKWTLFRLPSRPVPSFLAVPCFLSCSAQRFDLAIHHLASPTFAQSTDTSDSRSSSRFSCIIRYPLRIDIEPAFLSLCFRPDALRDLVLLHPLADPRRRCCSPYAKRGLPKARHLPMSS